MNDNLVSIIMPAYNAEKFIAKSIESVIAQTYKTWELIVVDDCASDNTAEIVKAFEKTDNRIKYIKLEKNSGAAIARKTGIEKADGRFMAFLDSDDIWLPEKLKKQIGYMLKNDISFSCTVYGKINEQGKILKTVVDDSNIKTYNDLLKNCPGNSTVIYDAAKIGKVYPSDIRKRNDYVLWLSVIKKSKTLSCYPELLGYHRITPGSISSNKLSLIKYHWKIYRTTEHLNPLKSLYLILFWCSKGVRKIVTQI